MKVEIIGLGVAGGFAAEKIAEKGYEVRGYDLKKEVMPAKCGELLRRKYLEQVKIKPEKRFIDFETRKILLGLKTSNKIDYFDMKSRDSYYVLNRQEFEKRAIEKAMDNGAELSFNHVKKEFSQDADFRIGAWGVSSPIEKYSLSELSYGQQYLMEEVEVNDKITFIISNEEGVKYYWIFPKGEKKANVGIFTDLDHAKEAEKRLNKFIEENEFLKKGAKVREVKKAIASSKPIVKEKLNQNFLLIGDAGGFCDSLTGGGINSSLLTAKAASEAIGKENAVDFFFEKNKELIQKLEEDYHLSKKFYDEKEKASILRREIEEGGEITSISNMIKEAYSNEF